MKPRFATIETWQQAELLMQPTFIRLIDNLRKQLDLSTWKGTYHDIQVWADDIPAETKETVFRLQQQLETASPEQAAEIQETLTHLPSPYPGYELRLEKNDRQVNIELWELCYRICFRSEVEEWTDDFPAEVDSSLFDDAGEVEWTLLEEKTKQIVEKVFEQLPPA
ncbi:MAG TPA: hypothetical protein VL134_10455 [Leptolyngbya sp.]|jgi:hypothetical protein|nr:hypothetical protein [Leptolyngbya sp.]